MRKWKAVWTSTLMVLVVVAMGGFKPAPPVFKDSGNTEERIFTKTDKSTTGGIKGTIAKLNEPIEGIMAMCFDNPKILYKGSVGSNGSFSFNNLPAGIYDLVVIYPTSCYEGLQLMRRGDRSTLTKTDMMKVNHTVERSEKFFRVKTIFRLEGTTGRGNECRAFVTMLKENRHAYKLMIFRDIGPGWQVLKTRTIMARTIPKTKEASYPEVFFSKDLQRIRVSDHVKDVGKINLKKAN